MRFYGPFILEDVAEREWIVTNGLGGYASATLCGMNTRRYHGLLVAALYPPGGRHLLVSKLEEMLLLGDEEIPLATNQYPDGCHPEGFRHMQEFELGVNAVRQRFGAGAAVLEKRITMRDGENTTCVGYRNTGPVPFALAVTPLVNARDFHGETAAESITFHTAAGAWGGGSQVHLRPEWMREGFWLLADAGHWQDDPAWHRNMRYRWEERRGLGALDNHFAPGRFLLNLPPGAEITLTLTTHPPGTANLQVRPPTLSSVNEGGGEEIDRDFHHLRRAADSFLVRRVTVQQERLDHGRTVIAGYHWFGDWGRDTMIALPGLCLTTGRAGEAADILRTFAAARRRGLLPNVFSDSGEGGAYNAVDASLWFVYAVERYVHATGDAALVTEMRPALEEIIHSYRTGTDFGIGMDSDGLIVAAAPGWQLTWMDAKVGDWVVTPRQGKPVEINALWYNALRVMEAFAHQGGWATDYGLLAEQVRTSFEAYWYAEGEYLYDVLGAAPDAKLRPNQIFAVSLPYSPLDLPRARAVVAAVERALLTPYGLRTLAPDDPDYRPHYGGDAWSRDGAYHQGTVWAWLMGPYIEAYLRVNGHTPAARAHARAHARTLLQPLRAHLWDAGIGTISEIFDADPPHTPQGTISQAWSVAELLRVWELCRE